MFTNYAIPTYEISRQEYIFLFLMIGKIIREEKLNINENGEQHGEKGAKYKHKYDQ